MQKVMPAPAGVSGRDHVPPALGGTTSESCTQVIHFPFPRTVSHLVPHLIIWFAGWSKIITPFLWMGKLIPKKEQNAVLSHMTGDGLKATFSLLPSSQELYPLLSAQTRVSQETRGTLL